MVAVSLRPSVFLLVGLAITQQYHKGIFNSWRSLYRVSRDKVKKKAHVLDKGPKFR